MKNLRVNDEVTVNNLFSPLHGKRGTIIATDPGILVDFGDELNQLYFAAGDLTPVREKRVPQLWLLLGRWLTSIVLGVVFVLSAYLIPDAWLYTTPPTRTPLQYTQFGDAFSLLWLITLFFLTTVGVHALLFGKKHEP